LNFNSTVVTFYHTYAGRSHARNYAIGWVLCPSLQNSLAKAMYQVFVAFTPPTSLKGASHNAKVHNITIIASTKSEELQSMVKLEK